MMTETPFATQPEAQPYLVGQMAGNAVALPLHVLETTIPAAAMVPTLIPESPILGLITHQGRTIAVLSPSLFVHDQTTAQTRSDAARIVVLRSGFGLLFDDLHFVSPDGLGGGEVIPLDPAQYTGTATVPQGALPAQIFMFHIQGNQLGIRLDQLHHLKLAQTGEISFATELDALCHIDAPGIPVFQPSGDGSFKGEWGHILYVNLADGTNCGFIVNDGEMADPGAPMDCDVFECGPFVSERVPFHGLAVPRGGQPFLLLDVDRYFAHCYGSPAMVGGVTGFDGDEGAPTSSGDFAA